MEEARRRRNDETARDQLLEIVSSRGLGDGVGEDATTFHAILLCSSHPLDAMQPKLLMLPAAAAALSIGRWRPPCVPRLPLCRLSMPPRCDPGWLPPPVRAVVLCPPAPPPTHHPRRAAPFAHGRTVHRRRSKCRSSLVPRVARLTPTSSLARPRQHVGRWPALMLVLTLILTRMALTISALTLGLRPSQTD